MLVKSTHWGENTHYLGAEELTGLVSALERLCVYATVWRRPRALPRFATPRPQGRGQSRPARMLQRPGKGAVQ
jgi:hypothetical protein